MAGYVNREAVSQRNQKTRISARQKEIGPETSFQEGDGRLYNPPVRAGEKGGSPFFKIVQRGLGRELDGVREFEEQVRPVADTVVSPRPLFQALV